MFFLHDLVSQHFLSPVAEPNINAQDNLPDTHPGPRNDEDIGGERRKIGAIQLYCGPLIYNGDD